MFVLGNYCAKSSISLHKAFSSRTIQLQLLLRLREKERVGIEAIYSAIAAKNMDTLLTIVEKSSAIIANNKVILSKSAPLVLKIVE
jgi:hypothetical protein